MTHLIELRSRLIKALLAFFIAAAACFFFAKPIYNVLVWPYVWVAGAENSKFIYTALLEYFVTQLKLSLFGAAFIAFPVIATQIYMFVAPGLYRNERQAFLPYLVATPIFFLLGSTVVYFVVMPMLVRFSLGMQQTGRRGPARDRAAAQGRRIPVADDVADPGLRRRLPAAGDPDAARPHRHRHLGDAEGEAALFHRHRLRHRRGADPARRAVSQMSLALPLLLLYEGSIWSVRMVEGKAAKAKAEAAAEGRRPRPSRRSESSWHVPLDSSLPGLDAGQSIVFAGRWIADHPGQARGRRPRMTSAESRRRCGKIASILLRNPMHDIRGFARTPPSSTRR